MNHIYTVEGLPPASRVVEWDVTETTPDRVRTERREPGSKTMMSVAREDESRTWWDSRQAAQEVADTRNEEYRLKPNQVRCQYCRHGVDADKAVIRSIYSRVYSGGRSKPRAYCSKECASNDQMGHEG